MVLSRSNDFFKAYKEICCKLTISLVAPGAGSFLATGA